MFKTKKSRNDAAPAAKNGSDKTFASSEIADIAGVSLRQLQWWDEQKVVSPRHEGHKRVYLPEEAVEIAVIAELRRKGFSLQKIRRVLRFLQKEMGKRLGEIMNAGSEMHLVTDGKSIYLEDSQERIIDIFKSASQPMFLVCVTDQVRRLSLPGALDGKSETTRKPVRGEITATVRKSRAV
jgi:DNA-binding transcriptional MerR regulator